MRRIRMTLLLLVVALVGSGKVHAQFIVSDFAQITETVVNFFENMERYDKMIGNATDRFNKIYTTVKLPLRVAETIEATYRSQRIIGQIAGDAMREVYATPYLSMDEKYALAIHYQTLIDFAMKKAKTYQSLEGALQGEGMGQKASFADRLAWVDKLNREIAEIGAIARSSTASYKLKIKERVQEELDDWRMEALLNPQYYKSEQ